MALRHIAVDGADRGLGWAVKAAVSTEISFAFDVRRRTQDVVQKGQT